MRCKTHVNYLVDPFDRHHDRIKNLLNSKPSSHASAMKALTASERAAASSSNGGMIMSPVTRKSTPKRQQHQQTGNKTGMSVASFLAPEGSFLAEEQTLRDNHDMANMYKTKLTRSEKQELSPGKVLPLPGKSISPQLAHVWEDHQDKFDHSVNHETQLFIETDVKPNTEEGIMVSLKLDGIRCTVQTKSTKGNNVPVQVWRNSEKRIVAQSRHKKEFFSVTRITKALEPLFEMFPSLVLDGEIYRHDVDFNDLSGAIRNREMYPTDETRAIQSGLQFFIFDIANYEYFNVKKMDYTERMKILRKMLKAGVDPKLLSLPEEIHPVAFHQPLSRIYAVKKLFKSFKRCAENLDKPIAMLDSVMIKKEDVNICRDLVIDELKLEGLMIRHQRAAYIENARSPYLLKVKKMHDAEFRIVGFTEGKGKWKGCLGAFTLQTKTGKRFKASFSGPDAVKRKMWILRNKFMGHLATVHYQEISSKGIPRFPVVKGIRGKSKKDCI